MSRLNIHTESDPRSGKRYAFIPNLQVDGDVVFMGDAIHSDQTGTGIKLGDRETASFGWEDMLGPIEVRGVGANDPTWAAGLGSGAQSAYSFAVNDECWIPYHVPHNYVPGTDIYFHVHYIKDGTNVQPVKWEFNYIHAKGHQQQAFTMAGTTVTVEQTPEAAAWTHQIAETVAQTLTGLEVDSMIYMRMRMITNGATENTDGIYVLTADLHYQSTGKPTLNKAPNFYGT